MGACGFKRASNLASDLFAEGEKNSLELFGAVLGITLCNLINPVLTFLIGFARNEQAALTPIAFGAAGGALIGTIFTVAWSKANLITRNLEFNAMAYLTPALALIWLFAFSLAGDVEVGYLASGAALMFLANGGLYLYLKTERLTPTGGLVDDNR